MRGAVDCHVHVYPPEVIRDWERIAQREPYFKTLASGKIHRWATAEDLLTQMETDGIGESWIFGFAFSDLGLCRLCNDYVIESVRTSSGRLKGLAVVPPLAPGSAREIERCREEGLIGVGELFPLGQGFDIADKRQTWRLAGMCHEMGLFLLVHVAEPVGHDYPGKGNVGPKEAYCFCFNHPEVTTLFAHWGGGLWLYELMPEVKLALSNAYYDTAATPFLYGAKVFDAAMSAGVLDKILYGSDYPILSAERYRRLLEGSSLTEKNKEALLKRNAERLLQGIRASNRRR
ncbi:MAG: Putative TIM-barrel fold metal-dependent hydrolase [Synergistales bacterium 54_24]|nr:MAG: Putative TIM-barrel fold metal-dependent hydrolase [Synergistales bacterium 54_24]HAF50825.1 metal-dependent hydrolase [Synergistaceae bacterium]